MIFCRIAETVKDMSYEVMEIEISLFFVVIPQLLLDNNPRI